MHRARMTLARNFKMQVSLAAQSAARWKNPGFESPSTVEKF